MTVDGPTRDLILNQTAVIYQFNKPISGANKRKRNTHTKCALKKKEKKEGKHKKHESDRQSAIFEVVASG